MNIPEGYRAVSKNALLTEYAKYIQGKRDNPFLYCGCVTPTGIHFPIKSQPDNVVIK